jgi:AraC-like DNA-binding protein
MKSTVFDAPFIYLISLCLLAIMITLLLLRINKGDKKATKLLFGFFAANFYLIGITYVYIYENGSKYPHTLRTGNIAALLMAPLSFWYIKQCLFPSKFSWKDILHLLPAIFYIIDLTPFFILSGAQKQAIFFKMSGVEYRIGFSQGMWMPTFGYIILRTIQMLVYWIVQIYMLARARRDSYHPLRMNSPNTWRWLYVFLYTQIAFFLIPLLGSLLVSPDIETVVYSMAYVTVTSVQCIYILLHPEVLSPVTFENKVPKEQPVISQEIDFAEKKKENLASKLPDMEIEEVKKAIEKVMASNRPLLHPYTLTQLADDTALSPHRLSAFINANYETNFSDFINRFRIKAVIRKIESGESSIKTLEAIANECGFQSRTTFIRAFKKELGITPKAFIDQKVIGNAELS